MKISVIIPVYNTEKFISRALDSILSQDYKDFEIICIDDGSMDNSAKIIKEKANDYPCIKYFYQENKGPGAARKNGFLAASGDLVLFLDSDDYLVDNLAFSKVVNIYSEYNPDIVLFDLKKITKNDETKIKPYCGNDLLLGYNKVDSFNDIYITANLYSKIMKRKLLSEDMFIEANTFEDFYTSYLYIDKCTNYYYLDEELYCVYHGEDNDNHITLVENVEKKKKRFNIIYSVYNKANNIVLKKCIANYCSQVIIGEINLRFNNFFNFQIRKDNKRIKEEIKKIIKILNETKFEYKPSSRFKFIKKCIFNIFLITHR